MNNPSASFSLIVDSIEGSCPSGEKWAKDNMARGRIPVLSCEGPCVRGDIARLAANIVAREEPYARACYAESALVPHSAMAAWVKSAEKIVMVDGCFLRCIGRVINNIANKDRIIHIDALALHKKYATIFHMDDVPEVERTATAQLTADKILSLLRKEAKAPPSGCCSDGGAPICS